MSRNGNDQMPAYSEAVKSGLYEKHSGLVGKYDNVRRLWEDEISRHFLRPHLQKLIDRCRQSLRRVRILDLGCGSGDGYELLTGIRDRDADLEQVEVDLLSPDVLGQYKGVDLNEDLLRQAAEAHGHRSKLAFEQASFTEGLPLAPDEPPYDLYFTSFGTCSHHNEDETMIRLLVDIARRTEDYCLINCDWLGRYSYEWQNLWTHEHAENRNMDYVVSYIYEKEEREARRDELQHLTLRLMSRSEADAIIAEASRQSGVEIRPLCFYDRSVFTGRHIDTGEYNPGAQPIRNAVNSLHEVNRRTDLQELLFDYVPKPGFEFLNRYYEHLQGCWNYLVHHVITLLKLYDEESRAFSGPIPEPPAACPAPLQRMRERMERVVEGTGWYGMGLPRENIIEPQLGYALRDVITKQQQGQGCGHGLVGVLEIDKT
ncbi:MAG: class I SAM-dependent methyltransferase [Lentisphaerae bacterium]|nr:class I SAM-dependent methyltransferase [Lentisphaerota bacterium]